jgi:hypothetical protein
MLREEFCDPRQILGDGARLPLAQSASGAADGIPKRVTKGQNKCNPDYQAFHFQIRIATMSVRRTVFPGPTYSIHKEGLPMKKLIIAAALVLLAIPVAAQTVEGQLSAGKDAVQAEMLVELQATVGSIDLDSREVMLKSDKGEEMTVVAGPDVKRLDEVKVGDRVSIEYYESLTLAVTKVEGDMPSETASAAEMRSEPTELPGGVKVRQATIAAKVTAIDAKASTVTLLGPKGRSVTLEVQPDVAANLKAGDMVNAVYTEALAVSLSRVKAD